MRLSNVREKGDFSGRWRVEKWVDVGQCLEIDIALLRLTRTEDIAGWHILTRQSPCSRRRAVVEILCNIF